MDPTTTDSVDVLRNIVMEVQPDDSEIISQGIALASCTIMCALFGIKTYNVQFKYLTYSRWLVVMLYINSWAFTYAAVVLSSTNNGK